ncbi:hypothetical protein [Virgisporangium aliadipatigenens]|uniref:hypothetical protein n=1 Tax=Virgisporangium aliadipatigenens TaxID=741659 RepID=UPI001941B9AB|nr:hypothetical protein [Virgisporangium aliadipatigenens]
MRKAPGYPGFLRAARLYAGGFAILPCALVPLNLGSDLGFALLVGIAAALVAAGVVLLRRALRLLDHDLAGESREGIGSAATIAAFQDLIRARRAPGR